MKSQERLVGFNAVAKQYLRIDYLFEDFILISRKVKAK